MPIRMRKSEREKFEDPNQRNNRTQLVVGLGVRAYQKGISKKDLIKNLEESGQYTDEEITVAMKSWEDQQDREAR